MEKTIIAVKRIGEIRFGENPNGKSGYKMITIPVEIKGKKAEITFEEKYKSSYGSGDDRSAKMTGWHFTTGDPTVDVTMKIQTDFAAYDLLDITIDINDLLTEAENIFEGEKKKEQIKKAEQAKIDRAIAYDTNDLINIIKPALEGKGHVVTVSVTKEDFVEKEHSISIMVDAGISVGRDYSGRIEVSNNAYGDNKITKSTRSEKISKIVETVEWVIDVNKARAAQKKEKQAQTAGAKGQLEKALGISIVEKKEYHSGSSNGYRGRGNSPGYETSYFVKAELKESNGDGIRFEESSVRIGSENVKGFRIKNLPIITDMVRLKAVFELLNG